ncbi:hypothetical protein V2O64_13910 [Verrucomicrobiaceae bacterium 227]
MIKREEFFNRYWASLENEGWEALILHSWQNLPTQIDSDVDYAVAGCSPGELLRFLECFAREHGWKLVQVIEHEPSAYFCVCMQDGGDFEQIALDVTWDYRRLGHLLVDSGTLQKDAREVEGKSFKVPSPGAEAAYILAKAAAKGKEYPDIESRLQELYHEDSEGFVEILERTLGFQSENGGSESKLLSDLKKWYSEAEFFKPLRAGRRYGLSEIQLYLRRCRQPTGLWLGFSSRGTPVAEQLLDDTLKPVKPLYRRNQITREIKFPGILKALSLLIRTSLSVETRARRNLMAAPFRTMIEADAASDSREMTREILAHLNERLVRRIAKL